MREQSRRFPLQAVRWPSAPLQTGERFGLVIATCGHFGLAAAFYLAMCDIALDKPGLSWDATGAIISCALIAAGRRFMAEGE